MTKPKPKTPAPIASEIGAFPDTSPPAAAVAEVETITPKTETTAGPADLNPAVSETKPEHSEPVGYMLQPRLAGYRFLTERDAALINRVKAAAKATRELAEDLERFGAAADDLQTAIQSLKIGFSLLTRSIAKPTEW